MDQQGAPISRDIIYNLLQACTKTKDLVAGRRVHNLMISNGLDSIPVFVDHLIRFYALCGSLVEANQIFSKGSERSVYTWNAIISAHAMLGECHRAPEFYHRMQIEGIKPDRVTFLCTLKACASMEALGQGRLIHYESTKRGLDSDVVIGNTLIYMYNKCKSLKDAQEVFDNLLNRDVASWGVMISGYAQLGDSLSAFGLFDKMQQSGVKPDKVTYLCLLKACGNTRSSCLGNILHDQITKSGLELDLVIRNTLVDTYAKCGSVEEAYKMFKKLPDRDVVSWGAMIAGYVRHGHNFLALEDFRRLQDEGITPSKVLFLCSLKACGSIGAIGQGRLIHDQIIRSGLELEILVGSTLVDMYSKCGGLAAACKIFEKLPHRDVVSWGAMIAGYAHHGYGDSALEFFVRMQQEGLVPNKVIFLCSLKACGITGVTGQGRLIHDHLIRSGFHLDSSIGNTLTDMYVKCGNLEDAYKVFNKMTDRDVVSWGAMIAGHAEHGHSLTALQLFKKMQQDNIKPDKVTFLCSLKACSSLGAIEQGRLVHDHINKCGLEIDLIFGNTLVDMYAKCGTMQDAQKAFDNLTNQDEVTWAAMIAGYAQCGLCGLARQCFEKMQQEGLKPNDAVFISILATCSHGGLLEEGCLYFNSMTVDHGITPSIEHYSCVVDLLGRAGYLNEAEDLLETMPIGPNIIVWTSLLSSCRTFGSVELGRQIFDRVVQVDPSDASGYVLMSNIYANAQMREDVERIQELRTSAGAWKKPGSAWIESDNSMSKFVVGSKSYLKSDEIHLKLRKSIRQMKEEGHVPNLDLALNLMSDEDREDDWCEDLRSCMDYHKIYNAASCT